MKPEHREAIERIDADRRLWMKTELMVDCQLSSEVAARLIDEFFLTADPSPDSHLRGAIAAFETAYPDLYWHVAKGKICAGEPLYGAIITTIGGTEIGHGESDESAEAAFAIAVAAAGLATTEGQP